MMMAISLHVSAQLTASDPGTAATTGSTGATTAPTGAGPLDSAASPTAAAPVTNSNNANGLANIFSQIFRNPMLAYGLTGGDNLHRAFMMPFMSRLGASNTANYYYMNGGMDKFFNVMMTDWANRMLAQSTGMNPRMSAFLTGQIFDAPDHYALANYLFSGMRRNQNNNMGMSRSPQTGSSQSQRSGLLPNGAASASSPNSIFGGRVNSGWNPMALVPLAWGM